MHSGRIVYNQGRDEDDKLASYGVSSWWVADKEKMVNYLLSVSPYLLCIFLYIIVILCLFYCFKSILEGNGRKELKQGENKQIWQISTQQAKIRQTGRPSLVDRLWQRLSATALATGVAAPAIRKLSKFFFFGLYKDWATWQIMF